MAAPDKDGIVVSPDSGDKVCRQPLVCDDADTLAFNPRDLTPQGREREAVFGDTPAKDSSGFGGGLEDVAGISQAVQETGR